MVEKLVVFDFDGVIADTLERIVYHANIVSKKYGVFEKITSDVIKNMSPMEFETIGIEIGLSQNESIEFSKDMVQAFSVDKAVIPIFQDIEYVLRKLEKKYVLVIISGNSSISINRVLNAHKIGGLFSDIFTKEGFGSKKDKLKTVVTKYRCNPSEVYFIGDAESDIQAAEYCRVNSIAVFWGNQNKDILVKSNPKYTVEKPMELLGILG